MQARRASRSRSSFGGLHGAASYCALKKKVRRRRKRHLFDSTRNHLRVGRSRSGRARHLRSEVIHFPNGYVPPFLHPSGAARRLNAARNVAKRDDGAPTLIRRRRARARVTPRSLTNVSKIALIFKKR